MCLAEIACFEPQQAELPAPTLRRCAVQLMAVALPWVPGRMPHVGRHKGAPRQHGAQFALHRAVRAHPWRASAALLRLLTNASDGARHGKPQARYQARRARGRALWASGTW